MGPVYRDAIKGYALHHIPVKYNVQGNCTVRLVEEGHGPGILTVKFICCLLLPDELNFQNFIAKLTNPQRKEIHFPKMNLNIN